jgi:hypothetical protein
MDRRIAAKKILKGKVGEPIDYLPLDATKIGKL